jgi:Big-like domain-containing protein
MPSRFIQPLESRVLFAADAILFIRGGTGTGGFIDGGTLAQRDEELADIHNLSTANGNHGWGELANLLRGDGFDPQQIIERPNKPIDLTNLDLSKYKTIVFGSNNADYTPGGDKTIVKALANYVFAGGSALFISDGNFGSTYSDAPNSDKDFLVRFGLNVNQDFGTYSLTRSTDFRAADHPILKGVNTIDGEGVSPGVRVAPVAGVTPQVLINAKSTTRNNDSAGKGSNRAVTDNDGTLVVATAGLGRIAIHFDRNTFFNSNGAGTDLHHFDNARYATNLFEWLAGRTPPRPQVQAEDFQVDGSKQTLRIAFSRYVDRSISTDDVKLINRKTRRKFAVKSVGYEASSNTAVFTFASSLSSGNYRATLFASGVTDTKRHPLSSDVLYNFHVSA